MIWHVGGDVMGGRHRLLPGVAQRVRGGRLLAGPVAREGGDDVLAIMDGTEKRR